MFFLGEHTVPKFVNERLYREGQGVFPCPLLRETQLLVDRLEKSPDIEPAEQGVWSIFSGERNSYLAGVAVERYFSLPKSWQPPADSSVHILARLRNGEPLAVEHPFGQGRVVAMLSTAAPTWNNWGRNPSFVVAILEMQSFLAGSGATAETRLVGVPITVEIDPAHINHKYASAARFARLRRRTSTPRVRRTVCRPALPTPRRPVSSRRKLATLDNQEETRRFAVNVNAEEGDLATVDRDQLATRLPGVHYEYRTAADFQVATRELAGSNISDWLLYILVGILVGEQLLAYSASYHPRAKEGAR